MNQKIVMDEANQTIARLNRRGCTDCFAGRHFHDSIRRHDSACECPCWNVEVMSCGCFYDESTDTVVAYCQSDGEAALTDGQKP